MAVVTEFKPVRAKSEVLIGFVRPSSFSFLIASVTNTSFKKVSFQPLVQTVITYFLTLPIRIALTCNVRVFLTEVPRMAIFQ